MLKSQCNKLWSCFGLWRVNWMNNSRPSNSAYAVWFACFLLGFHNAWSLTIHLAPSIYLQNQDDPPFKELTSSWSIQFAETITSALMNGKELWFLQGFTQLLCESTFSVTTCLKLVVVLSNPNLCLHIHPPHAQTFIVLTSVMKSLWNAVLSAHISEYPCSRFKGKKTCRIQQEF